LESFQEPQNVHASFGMAWPAYIRPVIFFLVLLSIGLSFVGSGYSVLGVMICLFSIALVVLQVLSIRSVRLYTDEDGVWVYSGILPWSKGIRGVKWRDLEDAVYFTGFCSWILKSYTVRMGHRFTKTSEIVLPHMARGNLAVEHINALHREVLAVVGQA
jgi:hypothetical protein